MASIQGAESHYMDDDFTADDMNQPLLNFEEIKAMLYRQRFIFLLLVPIALLIGFVVTMLMTPIYEATAKVQIEADTNSIVDQDGDVIQQVRGAEFTRFMMGKLAILRSSKTAEAVANELNLIGSNDFLEVMNVEPVLEPAVGETLAQTRRQQTLEVLSENLVVDTETGSNVANVIFQSPDGELSKRVANAYAEGLITANIAQRFETASYAREFLEKEIANAKELLEDSERASIEYARNSQIIDASDGISTQEGESSPKSITTANLVQGNSDLAEARTARVLAEQRWRQAQRTSLMNLPEVQSSPAIQNLQAQAAQNQAQITELSRRYKPGHPAFKEARANSGEIDAQINRLARDIRNSIESEYRTAASQEQALAQQVEGFKSETLEEQNRRVELNLLAREVDTNRTQYDALLERYKNVSTASDVVTNNITIIDEANSALQVAPRWPINMAIALLAGLGLAAGLAFLRETWNNTVGSTDDVQRKLSLPVLGVTPIVEMDQTLLAELGDPKSVLSEAYSSIRSSLDFSTRDGAPKSVLVTSAQASEGKSTTAVALAQNFGRMGKKVLLVDADLRSPSLHTYTNSKNNAGFVAVSTGQAVLADNVISDDRMQFDLLPSGPIPPNPVEILAAENIERFLREVAHGYDHVVFDGPPVMGLADAPQISRATAGTIFVAQAGGAATSVLQNAVERLRQAGARISGAVLSRFDSESRGYGHNYGYHYDYGSSRASEA